MKPVWTRVPDTGPVYFAYDAAGNRTMMQDGSGATYWVYDALNRITTGEADWYGPSQHLLLRSGE